MYSTTILKLTIRYSKNNLPFVFVYLYLNLDQVPWTDLRYLFGDIMYGGHITDDWDRRLCRTYLSEYMKPELVSLHTYHNSNN